MSVPAGWYDDGQGAQRWWDGLGWTDHVRSLPAPPPPPPPPPPAPAAPPQEQHREPAPAAGHPERPGGPSRRGSGRGGRVVGVLVGALVLLVGVGALVAWWLDLGPFAEPGPAEVATEYAEAFAGGDYAEACALLSDRGTKDLFETYGVASCGEYEDAVEEQVAEDEQVEGAGDADDFDTAVEVGEADVDDDEATVPVTTTTTYEGDDPDLQSAFAEPQEETIDLALVRVDGAWLVDDADTDSDSDSDEEG